MMDELLPTYAVRLIVAEGSFVNTVWLEIPNGDTPSAGITVLVQLSGVLERQAVCYSFTPWHGCRYFAVELTFSEFSCEPLLLKPWQEISMNVQAVVASTTVLKVFKPARDKT